MGWRADSQNLLSLGGTIRSIHTEVGGACHRLPLHIEAAHSLTLVVYVSEAAGERSGHGDARAE